MRRVKGFRDIRTMRDIVKSKGIVQHSRTNSLRKFEYYKIPPKTQRRFTITEKALEEKEQLDKEWEEAEEKFKMECDKLGIAYYPKRIFL